MAHTPTISGPNEVQSGVPADFDVLGLQLFSALSGGTLYAIDRVTQETFGAQGTYTLSDADLDLLLTT